jgi:hypothetical protein
VNLYPAFASESSSNYSLLSFSSTSDFEPGCRPVSSHPGSIPQSVLLFVGFQQQGSLKVRLCSPDLCWRHIRLPIRLQEEIPTGLFGGNFGLNAIDPLDESNQKATRCRRRMVISCNGFKTPLFDRQSTHCRLVVAESCVKLEVGQRSIQDKMVSVRLTNIAAASNTKRRTRLNALLSRLHDPSEITRTESSAPSIKVLDNRRLITQPQMSEVGTPSLAEKARRKTRDYPELQNNNTLRPATSSSEPLGSGQNNDTPALPSLDELMEVIEAHRSVNAQVLDSAADDLPKFDDLTMYGLDEKQEELLLKTEAQNLLDVVGREDPIPFSEVAMSGASLREDFDRLSTIADKMMFNILICALDQKVVFFEHCKPLFDKKEFEMSKRRLEFKLESYSKKGDSALKEDPSNVSERRLYYAIVDFIFASAARFALHTSREEPLRYKLLLLAGFTKLAAKLKWLSVDSLNFGETSLDAANDAVKQRPFSALLEPPKRLLGLSYERLLKENPEELQDSSTEQAKKIRSIEELMGQDNQSLDMMRYFIERWLVTVCIRSTVARILSSLLANRRLGLSSSAFDMCSLIHSASLSPAYILLCQERDGEICGTTNRGLIRQSYAGFVLLDQTITELSRTALKGESTPSSSNIASKDEVIAFVDFKYEELSKQSRTLDRSRKVAVTKTSDLIKLMIHLAFTQAPIARDFLAFQRRFQDTCGDRETNSLVNRGPRFDAFASLRTRDHVSESQKLGSDVRTLSESLLAKGRLDIYDKWSKGKSDTGELAEQYGKREEAAVEAAAKQATLEMVVRSWIIEETAIRVNCHKYVIVIMICCTVLVIGGILVGVLLGQRLKGVDPFGITTYAWVLAGFSMIVAKSLRVNDWPWRDFLLGRVPCRSVSELHNISGVDSQDIIGYLLSCESSNILITRGPYNQAFSRRAAAGDGFAIDVKLELRTMVANGLIGVKVAGTYGDGLVFLDMRHGMETRDTLGHSDNAGPKNPILGCYDTPEAFDENQEMPLQRRAMSWDRILGIYHRPRKILR